MFEKSLQDLVKGIRAHKRDPSSFISTSIAECKQELRSVDAFVKAQAVRKLTYLQMMGYDVSWASFAIVETMSQARFAHKRIGYLAACQCFSESTDVVLLTTNLLKKEFQSTSQYEVGLAVNCLANIVTLDLARDLLGDSVLLMSHTKPYVRKKAVSAMFKLFMQYPHGLRLTFDKFKERLGDPESAVTSCAVNVICELAHKNPSNYLSMAPQFFRLLTTSSNNWMLIKVVKLLGSLVPEEPRLARKLLEPLATIIQNTQAKSLQYEFTKKADGAEARNVPGIVKLCAEHLRGFIEDADQNLKYLGLVGFVELMQSHPKAVVEHKELVLLCLSDDDITIRTRALELLTGMVTRRNLEELVVKLLSHVARADGTYRDELISRIVFMCSRDKYAYLSDFAWYLSVLVQLAHLRGSKHGGLLAEQLVDVTMRVRPIRRYAARDMVVLLLDDQLTCGQGLESIADVLAAAAWIAGEYAASLAGDEDDDDDDEEDDADAARVGPPRPTFPKARLHEKLVDILTHPRVANLPPRVQNVYLQNALKVLALACGSTEVSDDELSAALDLVAKRGDVFLQSVHMEVQERAASLRGILEAFGALARGGAVDVAAARRCAGVLAALAAEKMAPVNPKAQARVPAPDGMDLGASVATVAVMKSFFEERDSARVAAHVSESPASLPFDEAERRVWASVRFVDAPFADDDDADGFDDAGDDAGAFEKIKDPEAPNVSVRATSAKANSAGTLGDPFYLSSAAPEAEAPTRARADDGGKRRGKKGATGDDAPRRRRVHKADVDVSELNPAGWVDSDDEKKARKKKPSARREAGRDSADLADVDITTPLRADEFIPKNEHRVVSQTPQPSTAVFKLDSAAAPAVGEKKKKKKPKDAADDGKKKKKKAPAEASLLLLDDAPAPAKKKKDKSLKTAVRDSGNLLDLLDLGGAAPAAQAPSRPVAENGDVFDLLGGGAAPAAPAKRASKKTSSKAKGGWAPLFTQGGIRAEYRFADGASIDVALTNTSQSDLFSSASVTFGGVTTALASTLPVGGTARGVAQLPPAGAAYKVAGAAAWYVEGLVPELFRADVSVCVPAAQLLEPPQAMTPAAFAATLGGHEWHGAAARLAVPASCADPLAVLAKLLQAHIVERQAASASMYARARTGAHLALLVKQKDGKLKVDIKATDAALANAVADLLLLLDLA